MQFSRHVAEVTPVTGPWHELNLAGVQLRFPTFAECTVVYALTRFLSRGLCNNRTFGVRPHFTMSLRCEAIVKTAATMITRPLMIVCV
jgi:hypothetical protein